MRIEVFEAGGDTESSFGVFFRLESLPLEQCSPKRLVVRFLKILELGSGRNLEFW